ncbi:hypothetical protein DUNSADRAFT_13189 [Dunaliella salina]|nr:hypothetical protein DUNSADRAFT_13189 [Dunaliella salina]|eukprot:KAF5831399.1 hypothetical protein DUNSADRAFT_13189 [Dunaliella salina]
MLVSSPDKDQFQSVLAEINSSIQGCMQGYLVGLTVKGVGYRLEPIEESVSRTRPFFEQGQYDKSNITYPHTKPVSAIRLKVGFSRTVVYPLPPDVRAFSIRPNLLYLYGLQLPRLQQIAQDIRSIRKPNVYTGNGIQLVGETIRLKQRSTRKR